MDCAKCKLEMVNLFDSDIDQVTTAAIKEHLLQCPDCAAEYRKMEEIIILLKPKVQPDAPAFLKQNIMDQLRNEAINTDKVSPKNIKLNSGLKKIISIAAVLAVIMIAAPFIANNSVFTAKAANFFIESSIKATHLVKSMMIKFKLRTTADENFSLVDPACNMVDHTILKTFESPVRWRIEKGERIVVFDGVRQYSWIPQFKEAWRANESANIIGWLYILLDPENILKNEQKIANADGSKVTMKIKDGELLMTITSKAKGNFINDFLKNTTIEESDNRREYIFDNSTKLLKGLKIYMLEGAQETLILNIDKIDYDIPVDPSLFVINLPAGVEWKELTNNYSSETFKNITSKRAAELFFTAMAGNNWKLAGETCDAFNNPAAEVNGMKEYFSGLTIIIIGEPFKSGLFPGEFVPYEIKLKSGEIIKNNLALRNDNADKVWIVDGGL